ncbi:hypothetical protein KC19_2G031400 [Ceratodon purpureus]|uniref:Uncharacterized protein n=1 Tax=Ceratodon purpureus TaxID=3225 RepID=A0A8T0ISE7_CERPU|nr:hypothetical protein KC19_2G031400 [Ceratodon purpureus]
MATGITGTMATAIHAPVSPHILSRDSSASSNSASVSARGSSSSEVCSVSRVKFRGLGFMRRSDEDGCGFGGLGCSLRVSSCNSSISASLRQGHFAEPSVTARDMEKYEKQLTEEEAVAKYLETVGVDTTSLDELGLPASLEIVRERVEFLQKIGLTVEDINDYPLILGYSVKRNLIPVLSYLESLGVTPKSLPILVRKYPQVLHSSVVIDLQPHVEYLEGLGIQRADMGSVLTRYPEVFGFKIEGTISTSTSYLIMLGVNPRRMGFILTELPQILGMRVGNNIKRKADFLKSFGLAQTDIAKIIETRPQVLGLDLAEQMRPAVDSLVELGVPQDAISRVIMQFPDILSLDVKRKLEDRLTWLTSEVGISADDMGIVIPKLPQILVINPTKATARVEFLKQAGFSAEEIGSMVTNCPQLLPASIEKSLKPNLDYLVEKMERKLAEVVEFPPYLLYNLEEIIRPRHEVTKEKGVECSLSWMLSCEDDVFQQRLTAEYAEQRSQDEEPDVPYIVARRVRLTDDPEDVIPLDRGDEAETKTSDKPDVPYIVKSRTRLIDDSDDQDDAQSRSFG